MTRKRADEPEQVSPKETEILLALANGVLSTNVSGDFVELGCYRGDTSLLLQKLLISSGNSSRRLFIYDSFAGLPERSSEDSSAAGEAFSAGKLFVTKREVVEKFKKAGVKLPIIKKGFFEDLGDADLPGLISFAFLDGDLYGSIKTSLSLVFPRLVSGGIMVVHDYNNPQLPGSARAVDEFLRVHPEFRLEARETLAIIRRGTKS
ncbi:class I SAM-dependent methyltransferase [Candidatus Saccharibacteria bacterium]|nr:class I SAM-dependent methyltransferase [Candidatus Saccharibacteria bacterium]